MMPSLLEMPRKQEALREILHPSRAISIRRAGSGSRRQRNFVYRVEYAVGYGCTD
jgi:hypothetical protein